MDRSLAERLGLVVVVKIVEFVLQCFKVFLLIFVLNQGLIRPSVELNSIS